MILVISPSSSPLVNKHSLNYPNRVALDPVIPPPQVIDDGATPETSDEEDISTAVPSTFPQPTKSPMTIDDKVDDMNDSLKTGQGCKLAVALTQKATRIPNSYEPL
jgi:hypothetical protein